MPRKAKDAPPDQLAAYRAKRSLERTPEPTGTVAPAPSGGRLFVVHKHAASHLHFDLRLEMNGVLKSWAVPKGPSVDPKEKRLAIHVEDHPLEYGEFEGLIPEGNYGAGAVIVWDRGLWVPIEDPGEGLQKGKLLFELKGYKLRGTWTLVKIKRGQKEWLLIRERKGYTPGKSDEEVSQASVLSGLTVEDLRDGKDPAEPIRKRLEKLGAPRRRVPAKAVELMLAETAEQPFSRPGWLFELKLDGYRIIAAREAGAAQLYTRGGQAAAVTFPEVARAITALPFDCVLDGEIVAPDDSGRPSFQRLQQRGRLSKPIEIKRAAVEIPTTYYAFDLLGFEDFDLRPLPLTERKAVLETILPPAGPLRYLDHFEDKGEALFEQVREMGLEGIVAKKAGSLYRAGRSGSWLKIRSDRTGDFAVVGFTTPKGSRGGFGALHLAEYVDGRLVYAGRAGSGFSQKQLDEVRAKLDRHARRTPPCDGPLPSEKDTTWVDPTLVVEVRFKERTTEGLLRQPVFVRFRDDKKVVDCVRQDQEGRGGQDGQGGQDGRGGRDNEGEAVEPVLARTVAEERQVLLTNLNKVFWPEEKYTKGDLIAYYSTMAGWMLPYLRGRPAVLTRYPDGIHGKSFYQKDAPDYAPDWIRRVRIWSTDTEREIEYFVIDDEPSLRYIANLGTIPIHIWGSRVDTLERPDWTILDLDPKEAPFQHVVEVAKAVHALCDEVDLPHYVKTSGSSGLHVLIPLGRQCTYEQGRTLAELLARIVASDLKEIATIIRSPGARGGRVYLDYLQNVHGQLLAAPFCLRPLPGAPVSTPLKWSEVNSKLDIRKFTIKTVPARMRRLKEDPLVVVLDERPDLVKVMERLAKRSAKARKTH